MIPKIIYGKYIPEVWEWGLRYILEDGKMLNSERGKVLTVFNLVCYIENPLEKMIHKKSPYDKKFLDSYKDQLLYGVKLPEGQEFEYNYHDRIFNYDNKTNQIENCINRLKENKYTRRAVFNTGLPQIDNNRENIPCLVEGGFYFDGYNLNLDCKMRSWDFYGGAPANLYAFAYLLNYVAENVELVPGSLNVTGRVLHIYKYNINDSKRVVSYLGRDRYLNIGKKIIRPLWRSP